MGCGSSSTSVQTFNAANNSNRVSYYCETADLIIPTKHRKGIDLYYPHAKKTHDDNGNVQTDGQNYDEIQKQTFLTDNTKENKSFSDFPKPRTKAEKAALHEKIASLKEQLRSDCDTDRFIRETCAEHNVPPIVIPEMDPERTMGEYTVDDIVKHNQEAGWNEWFKYGKKVYSLEKMKAVLVERDDYIHKVADLPWLSGHCIFEMEHRFLLYTKKLLITKEETKKLLAACQVGKSVEVPRKEYMARMKQWVLDVLEDPNDSPYMTDYKLQLNRWLADYPNSKIDNDKIEGKVDLNEKPFPLPKSIMADPTVLRQWSATWQPFDFEMPEGGSWPMMPLIKEDWGDVEGYFAKYVQSHDDDKLEPMDMTIEGDVAWTEIELELLKNDVTTPNQDAVWKTRANRTNINDPAWQAERRQDIGSALLARYISLSYNYFDLENHAQFAELLEQHWKQFEELCAKEFNPPTGNFRITKSKGNGDKTNGVSDRGSTADSGLELDNSES